jgi:hypothetical protein
MIVHLEMNWFWNVEIEPWYTLGTRTLNSRLGYRSTGGRRHIQLISCIGEFFKTVTKLLA